MAAYGQRAELFGTFYRDYHYNRVGKLGGMRIPKGDIGSGRLITMTEEGKSIGYFYGYQVEGIFQSQGEIDRYNALAAQISGDPDRKYQSNVGPGDLIYRDLDGNGYIDDRDRTDIGSPILSLSEVWGFLWVGKELIFRWTFREISETKFLMPSNWSVIPDWITGTVLFGTLAGRLPEYQCSPNDF